MVTVKVQWGSGEGFPAMAPTNRRFLKCRLAPSLPWCAILPSRERSSTELPPLFRRFAKNSLSVAPCAPTSHNHPPDFPSTKSASRSYATVGNMNNGCCCPAFVPANSTSTVIPSLTRSASVLSTAVKDIKDAVELLLDPLERAGTGEVDQSPGFVYSQALLAWFCAVRQDAAGAVPLAELVRRIGWALVLSHARLDSLGRFHLREDLRGNTPPEHFELSHVPIWGSISQDIVFQTFCI
ncbi:hypothetical protein AK812_SmicGene4771 [Symbiodinium microadriaticum]|uniref:Uncharacterized protein n=1 Tax=Symbiodinium microadriaticum TaxID=2951 RepID=A0A1Q9EVM6_SYMMI|nr:hypothetical protein AK812_SmicGene4771 [Symbiodinium microadriaticum]CAE7785666.1 unnamed protein product [Symbiodinium microadriaticum]CAE7915877.1 unnamed protein product [Symbiodinium sp. KB8]